MKMQRQEVASIDQSRQGRPVYSAFWRKIISFFEKFDGLLKKRGGWNVNKEYGCS